MDVNFTMTFTMLNDLYATQPKIVESDTTAIYPYIIVAAFFGTLVVAMGAAALYYRNKTRRANNSSTSSLSRSSNISDSIIVQHDHKAPSSTPPVENGGTRKCRWNESFSLVWYLHCLLMFALTFLSQTL